MFTHRIIIKRLVVQLCLLQLFVQAELYGVKQYHILFFFKGEKMATQLKKLTNYLLEVKTKEENWLIFNLLNFNYFLSDEPFSDIKIDELEDNTLKLLNQLGFVSEIDEEELFIQKKELANIRSTSNLFYSKQRLKRLTMKE